MDKWYWPDAVREAVVLQFDMKVSPDEARKNERALLIVASECRLLQGRPSADFYFGEERVELLVILHVATVGNCFHVAGPRFFWLAGGPAADY